MKLLVVMTASPIDSIWQVKRNCKVGLSFTKERLFHPGAALRTPHWGPDRKIVSDILPASVFEAGTPCMTEQRHNTAKSSQRPLWRQVCQASHSYTPAAVKSLQIYSLFRLDEG